jgi:hypothetical protein
MIAREAAYRVVHTALSGQGSWGTRVWADVVPAGVARPYAVYHVQADLAPNQVVGQDAEVEIAVKVVADTLAAAMTGAGVAHDLLDGAGEGESGALAAAGGWTLCTVTAVQGVHLVERYEGAKPIYHEGFVFQLVLRK